MISLTKRFLLKWMTVVGGVLLFLPTGLPWYWGNLSVYTTSFMYKELDTGEDFQTPWIISLYFLSMFVGLTIGGFLTRRLKKRIVLAMGVGLFLTGVFLTRLSLTYSLATLVLTISVVSGLGTGFITGLGIEYAVAWATDDVGLISGIVQAGFNAGPIFINPFTTVYINPNNLSPDKKVDNIEIFTQDAVIDRVLNFFLVFGGLCLGLQFIGFLLVREYPSNEAHSDKSPATKSEKNNSMNPKMKSHVELTGYSGLTGITGVDGKANEHINAAFTSDVVCETGKGYNLNIPTIDGVCKDKKVVLNCPQLDNVLHKEIVSDLQKKVENSDGDSGNVESNARDKNSAENKPCDNAVNLKPFEIIKTKNFYVLAVTLFLFDNAMLVLANFHKDYGAVYIADDHFLSYLGMALSVSTVFGSFIWGGISDKIGVKLTFVILFMASTLLSVSAYFTAKESKYLYMSNIAGLGLFLPPIFSIVVITNNKLFGKKYFSSNMGFVNCFSLISNFVNPIILGELTAAGWLYVFVYGSSLTFIAMILVVFALPNVK